MKKIWGYDGIASVGCTTLLRNDGTEEIASEQGILRPCRPQDDGPENRLLRFAPAWPAGKRNDEIASVACSKLSRNDGRFPRNDGMEKDHHLPEGLKVTWRKIVWPIGTSFTGSVIFVSGL